MALRNLLLRVGADVSELNKGMKKAQESVGKFKKYLDNTLGNIQGQMAGAMGAVGAGIYIHQGTQDAIKYEALMGTLNESMGDSIETFKNWQDESGSAMGFSKLAGAELANTLSLNFKRIATSSEDLVARTTKMMEIAAIISNKRGMLMSEVSDRIRSAMNQEADGADELGVNVRIAAIKTSNAYAQMADGKPWDQLSENLRKTILYHHILEQVSANLGNTLQDNVRLRLSAFQASLGDVRLALGQAFLPILYTVLPILTRFMRGLERALQYVSAFVRAMFGYKVGTKEALNNAQATEAQADAMGALGDSAEDTGKKASKAAKEIQRGVAGFDEVNLLPETGGGAGGAGGAGAGAGDLPMPPDSIFQPDKGTIGWMDSVNDGVDKMTKKFKEFLATSKGLKDLREGIKMFGQSIADLVDSRAFKKFIRSFKEDLPQFIDDTSGIMGGFLKFISGRIDQLTALLDNDLGKAWDGLGKRAIGVLDVIGGTVGLVFPDAGEKIQELADKGEVAWKKFGKEFVYEADSIGQVWDDVTNQMKASFGVRVAELTLKGTQKFKELKEGMIKNIIEGTIENKKSFEEFRKSAENSLTTLRTNSSWIFGAIKQTIKTRMEESGWEFKNPFSGIGTWFQKNVVDPINRAFRNLDIDFGNAVGAGFRSIFNEAAKRINGVLGKLTGIGIGGFYPFAGITRYAIPPLAKGGITGGAMLAYIGDNPSGHEVVAPLEKLLPMMTEAVRSAIAFERGNNNNVGGDVVLNIDGRSFARIVLPHIQNENKRVGANIRLNPI